MFFIPFCLTHPNAMNNLFQLDNDVAVVIGGTGELGGMMAEALA